VLSPSVGPYAHATRPWILLTIDLTDRTASTTPIDDWLDLGARIVELERVFNNARGFDRCDLGGDEGGSSGGDGNGAGGSRSENASADD